MVLLKIILISFCLSLNLIAQSSFLHNANEYNYFTLNKLSSNNNKSEFERIFENQKRYFSDSFAFNKNNLTKLTLILSFTAAAAILDKPIRNSNHKQTYFQDRFLSIGDYYGNGKVAIGLTALTYGSGFLFKNKKLIQTGRLLCESFIAAAIIGQGLKILFGRARPYNNLGVLNFRFFQLKNDFNSLPSGHAIVAFTTSTVLANQINNFYASFFLYSLAALTAYQRIYSDNHWFSDTILGAVIGVLVGNYFSRLEKKTGIKNNGKYINNISFSFYDTYFSRGLKIKYNF